MNIDVALRERRTVHRYRPDPVDEAVILRALDLARFAPCHKLTWPWRFVWPGAKTRARLAARGVSLKAPEGSPERVAKVRSQLLDPAELIVVCQVVDEDPHRTREDYAAVACAIHSAGLALHAEGLGSKWSTGALTRDPEALALLGIEAPEEVVGFLWVGHPKELPAPPPRPELDEFLRRCP